MANAPINVYQDIWTVYQDYFDGLDDDYTYPDPLIFDSVDAFVEDLRERMNAFIRSPVRHYGYGIVHGYDLERIECDGDGITIHRKRKLTEAEIESKEKAKKKLAARKAAAAEKKKQAELELLQKLKQKYENQVNTIDT